MKKLQVLLADDDQDLVEMTTELLRRIDAAVAGATNGHLAIDYVQRNQPDVVIVDLNMPLMDGVRLVESLVQGGFPPERIVVLTGSLDKARLFRLARAQIRHFFVKPMDPAEFVAKIQEIGGEEVLGMEVCA